MYGKPSGGTRAPTIRLRQGTVYSGFYTQNSRGYRQIRSVEIPGLLGNAVTSPHCTNGVIGVT